MIKVLIIEDEKYSSEMLADIINLKCDDVKVVGSATDVKSGIEAIEKYSPDLVMLDISLPDGTGFDILVKAYEKGLHFHVIFVTAYVEYAINAFAYSAIDYVLKPVKPEAIINAIQKYHIIQKGESQIQQQTLSENISATKENRKIVLKTADFIHVIQISNIIRCEGEANYTNFYTVDGKKYIISKALKEYENILEEQGFYRVHQSHIINLNYMESFDKKDGGFVIMKDKTSIPVSSRKRDTFIKMISSI